MLMLMPEVNLFSDAPDIHLPRSKQVWIELLRGHSKTLKCVAAANPSPTFTWRKGKHKISDGFNSTWNSSSLKVTPVSNVDFTSYVCTAENRLGWDSATFDLQEKGKCSCHNFRTFSSFYLLTRIELVVRRILYGLK